MALEYVKIYNKALDVLSEVKAESLSVWESLGWERAADNSDATQQSAPAAPEPPEEEVQEPVSEPVSGVNATPVIP